MEVIVQDQMLGCPSQLTYVKYYAVDFGENNLVLVNFVTTPTKIYKHNYLI